MTVWSEADADVYAVFMHAAYQFVFAKAGVHGVVVDEPVGEVLGIGEAAVVAVPVEFQSGLPSQLEAFPYGAGCIVVAVVGDVAACRYAALSNDLLAFAESVR